MATTVYKKIVKDIDDIVTEVKVNTLTAGLELDLSHGGPSGCRPLAVACTVITAPDDASPLTFAWIKDDDNTTNDTVRVRFDTTVGGDLTGAVVLLHCTFLQAASGGLNPPS